MRGTKEKIGKMKETILTLFVDVYASGFGSVGVAA